MPDVEGGILPLGKKWTNFLAAQKFLKMFGWPTVLSAALEATALRQAGMPAATVRCGAAETEAKAALSRRRVSPKSDEGGSETQAEAQHHGKGRARGGYLCFWKRCFR